MTTSPQKPSKAETVARNYALIDLNFEGLIIKAENAVHFEERLHHPTVLTWIATILNRRSQRSRLHYFYNQDSKCLDSYVLTEPPPEEKSQPESENTDDTCKIRVYE